MRCPSYHDLIEVLDGEHDPTLVPVRRHLAAGCPACDERNRRLEALVDALSAGPLPAVAPDLVSAAVALAREPRPGVAGRIRRFLGSLVLDTGPGASPALALRGEGVAERHLFFQAGPYEVDLALLEGGTLVGNVSADAPASSPALLDAVCVLHGDREPREATVKDNGDFHFEQVKPLPYQLLLESSGVRLFLKDLDLSAG